MSSYSDVMRRRYMDDSIFRSAPRSSRGCLDMVVNPREPRYSPRINLNNRLQTSYFDREMDDSYDRRRLSSHDEDFYGYDSESRWGSDEVIRRTNREVALANSAIAQLSRNVQLHPMMTSDGRYPAYFSVPRRLEEFREMSDRELEEILRAYDVGEGRGRGYRGPLGNSFRHDDFFHSSKSDRRRNLIVLFEFLGAHRLVEHLRCRY